MKGLGSLLLLQALLSTISGVLMANMSWVGRMGIWLIYKDYGTLRVWWKTALLCWGLQLLVVLMLLLGRKWLPNVGARMLAATVLCLTGLGGYATWIDFTTTSHRLMKADFHVGGYLVWAAMALSAIYFLFYPRARIDRENSDVPPSNETEKSASTIPNDPTTKPPKSV